jgi:hypothetical protein
MVSAPLMTKVIIGSIALITIGAGIYLISKSFSKSDIQEIKDIVK